MRPDDRGWIKTLLEEPENERLHLMIFIEIAKPNWFERLVILFVQFVFWHFYFILYVFLPKPAHRMVGYFEDQAVVTHTQYLEEIEKGNTPNIKAFRIAINHYNLSENATLKDVVTAVKSDELGHAEVNHGMADTFK